MTDGVDDGHAGPGPPARLDAHLLAQQHIPHGQHLPLRVGYAAWVHGGGFAIHWVLKDRR